MAKVRGPKRVRKKRRKRKVETDGVAEGLGQLDQGLDADDADPDGHEGLHLRHRRVGKGGAAGEADVEPGLGEGEDETGAATVDGIRRKGAQDGFDQQQAGGDQRNAYILGHAQEDAERFANLRDQGAVDTFSPELSPREAEQLGQIKCAAHLVRMYDHWMLDGLDRSQTIDQAATFLAGFSHSKNVDKVLTELESKPIRDVYPLEVKMRLLEEHPDMMPDVEYGAVLGDNLAMTHSSGIHAGHPVQIRVPPDTRIKHFALLGGERPGYEFHPSKKDGHYTLLVDTPGEYEFALYAVKTEKLGKTMTREVAGGVVERLFLTVTDMGRKEGPDVDA